jgi:hypothetical protein
MYAFARCGAGWDVKAHFDALIRAEALKSQKKGNRIRLLKRSFLAVFCCEGLQGLVSDFFCNTRVRVLSLCCVVSSLAVAGEFEMLG